MDRQKSIYLLVDSDIYRNAIFYLFAGPALKKYQSKFNRDIEVT